MRLYYAAHPRAYVRYWVAQLALFGWPALRGDRTASDIVRYRKIRPGVTKGLTRRFLRAWWKKEIVL